MKYCNECGKENTQEAKFCSSCGAMQQQAGMKEQAETQQSEVQQQAEMKAEATMVATQDTDVEKQDTKTMSILAYIIFLIPLIAGEHKKSEFIRFHTNQGTVLFIAAVIVGMACSVLTSLLIFIPGAWVIIPFFGFVWVLFLAFVIIGIVNVANDAMKPLPIIGGFTVIK